MTAEETRRAVPLPPFNAFLVEWRGLQGTLEQVDLTEGKANGWFSGLSVATVYQTRGTLRRGRVRILMAREAGEWRIRGCWYVLEPRKWVWGREARPTNQSLPQPSTRAGTAAPPGRGAREG
jgi:hypothetical protein